MTAAQKTAARQEITGMLEWCLTKGLARRERQRGCC
jgi:hypothetical protein